MKRLLTFDELINEKINNKSLVEHEARKMRKEISNYVSLSAYTDNFTNPSPSWDDNIYFSFYIENDELKFVKSIDKIISKYKNLIFPKIDTVMKVVKKEDNIYGYDENGLYTKGNEIISIRYEFTLKSINISRVLPKRYVFHVSDSKNRENIDKNGLIPKSDMDSPIWKNFSDVAYPPAIFATKDQLWSGGSGDVWVIDTKGLVNKWWSDLYFKSLGTHILTFESIPRNHIKRVSKERALDIIKKQENRLVFSS
jgi:hypothetical protein